MNKIPVEVTEVKMKNIRSKKLTLECEAIGEDFYIPRTMEKFIMVPLEEFKELEEKAWKYDELCK